ncbi:MAG: gliding motility-associated C-terminal domain-containing protein [Sphingobacteriales bacterium]|nr:MAG: gliding motility-associated C-terminal domain-containing protein [Sphingobacteriales bacterium]
MQAIARFVFTLSFLFPLWACAQRPVWVNQLTGANDADARSIAEAPNGDIYLAGTFTGTMDADPSAAVHSLTSKGGRDIFLACYHSDGSFVWGNSFGGPDNDNVNNVTVDKNNNPIIVGQFRNKNVDFAAANTTSYYLNAKGAADGFVAKYTRTGNLQWAYNMGGLSEYDDMQSVATDEDGSVYIGGNFHGDMDIDPSGGLTNLNSMNGTGCLIKLDANATLVWGFCFGGGGLSGIDNTVWGMKYGGDGYVYLTGCFQGAGDFDPSSGNAIMSANNTDAYISKYDKAGQFQFATAITGDDGEQALDIALDADRNIYITGFTESEKVNFSSSFSVNAPMGANGEQDIIYAKYSNAGVLQWGAINGGDQNDVGWGVTITNGYLYTTGYFQNNIQLGGGTSTETLNGKGRNDILLSKYDLDGKLVCAFAVGDTLHDNGRKILGTAAGDILVAGYVSPGNVDMDPAAGQTIINSTGVTDGFLLKYRWANADVPDGYLVGDSTCEGSQAYAKFIATAGSGPFDIRYSDGVDTYTVSGLENGEKFPLKGNITGSTVYTLTYIKGAGLCVPITEPGIPVSIVILPLPTISAGNDTSVCPGARVQLNGATDAEYYWYPADGLSDPKVLDPYLAINDTTIKYLAATNQYGCSDTDEVVISVIGFDPYIQTPAYLCFGDTTQLILTGGGDQFLWSPADSLYPADFADPYVYTKTNKHYTVEITDTKCGRSKTLDVDVIVRPLPSIAVDVKDIDCGLPHGQMIAHGGTKYLWVPSTGLDNDSAEAPIVNVDAVTEYVVTGTDANGCSDTANATVKVFEGKGRLFAPTAFTPNADGKNDKYRVHIPGDIYKYELRIFNRWGQQVYRGLDPNNGWDGIFQGYEAPLGTYYYLYKATSSVCNELEGQGDLQLIR